MGRWLTAPLVGLDPVVFQRNRAWRGEKPAELLPHLAEALGGLSIAVIAPGDPIVPLQPIRQGLLRDVAGTDKTAAVDDGAILRAH